MRVLCCFGQGEPDFSSARGIVHGLKMLGHDVLTCGPPYWNRGADCDLSVPDKSFPETYRYEEILNQISGKVDLVLQLEPHFFFAGPKPPEIVSAYYFTDPHRGGEMWYKMAIQGKFNHVFVGQKYFLPLFSDLPAKVHYLPVGFDERRFPQEDPYWQKEPECDVIFVGQTGLAGMTYLYQDDVGRYAIVTPNIHGPEKFAFGFHPGFDYAERGELLSRLCLDFTCRIYDAIWDTPNYFRALRKGTIGFHCSLLHDLSIRCLEIMAAGRLLITDEVEDIEEILSADDFPRWSTYRLYHKPFFQNFDLSYKELHRMISYWLLHDKERENLASLAKEHVWQGHSWQHRAQSILDTIFI